MSRDYDYSEDMFADTRMSFGEHLEELRMHMWRAIKGFLVALFFSFFIGKPVLQVIAAPVEEQLEAFYDARVERIAKEISEHPGEYETDQPKEVNLDVDVRSLQKTLGLQSVYEKLKLKPEAGSGSQWVQIKARINPHSWTMALHKAMRQVGRRPGLTTLSIQEAFMAYFKVCIYCGIVLGSPWIFWQLWLFVAAGLYPHEKRLVNVYLPISLVLFLCGVAMAQFVVIPRAVEALLWFNEWIGLEPDLRFNEWLSFAILMPLVFGVAFQIPLVMMFIERLGIVTISGMIGQWRLAFFIIEVFAAVFSPSIDAISMQLLALPMFALYWFGIFLCRFNPRPPDLDIDIPDSDEMVEV